VASQYARTAVCSVQITTSCLDEILPILVCPSAPTQPSPVASPSLVDQADLHPVGTVARFPKLSSACSSKW